MFPSSSSIDQRYRREHSQRTVQQSPQQSRSQEEDGLCNALRASPAAPRPDRNCRAGGAFGASQAGRCPRVLVRHHLRRGRSRDPRAPRGPLAPLAGSETAEAAAGGGGDPGADDGSSERGGDGDDGRARDAASAAEDAALRRLVGVGRE